MFHLFFIFRIFLDQWIHHQIKKSLSHQSLIKLVDIVGILYYFLIFHLGIL